MRKFSPLVMLIMFHVSVVCSADLPKSLSLEWDFRSNKDLVYQIIQKVEAQQAFYNFERNNWDKTPVHTENVNGFCYLVPLGDGTANGAVLLQLKDIRRGIDRQNVPHQQKITQLVSRFTLKPNGKFENYTGGDKKGTYLI